MNDILNAPNAHEIEISIFGRGYGESILVHYGDNEWILIDSIQEGKKLVSPLLYLEKIHVDIQKNLKLIIITHWHDDHISGISEVYKKACAAHFVMPLAMKRKELKAFQKKASLGGTENIRSGVSEIEKIAIIQNDNRRLPIKLAVANRILLRKDSGEMKHGHKVCVESLSPSDLDIDTFIKEICCFQELKSGLRVQPFEPNNIAVVLWVSIGKHRILLGSDLEVLKDPLRGWNAIFNSTASLAGKASFIKVPHHGSKNAHHERVWSDLLVKNPIAALTTWNRGSKLPTKEDNTRILSLTSEAYITSNLDKKPAIRSRTVDKILKQTGAEIRSLESSAGHIRMRLNLLEENPKWIISLFNGALNLSELNF